MLEYFKRIDELAAKSRKLPMDACADMLTMCNAVHDIAVELSKEMVDCRRRGRPSARSETLVKRLDDAIVNVEQMLTYAILLYPTK